MQPLPIVAKNKTACALCGSPASAAPEIVQGHAVYSCGSCGLRWVPGLQPAELGSFYDATYFSGDIGYYNYLADEQILRENARAILKVLGSLPEGGRLLDVGCAHGFLLDEARKLGWQVSGVELSEEAGGFARKTFGLDIFLGDLQQASWQEGIFDIITIIGSVEHFTDPVAYCEKMSRLLKPSGRLLLTTIDTAGWMPLYRLKPPEHLYYFNANNLRELFRKVNLEVIDSWVYWKKYRLSEALSLFFRALVPGKKWSFFHRSRILNFSLKLPTNEILFLCRKAREGNWRRSS
jgi:SAM-dependent methyltransferase